MKKFLLLIALSTALFACEKKVDATLTAGGGGNAPLDYSTANLGGKVLGAPFETVTAVASVSPSDPVRFRLSFLDIPLEDPCGFIFTQRMVMASVPAALGETVFGEGSPMASATFFSQTDEGSTNLVTTTGKVVVQSISDTEVTGLFLASLDADNVVNGAFTAKRCFGSF